MQIIFWDWQSSTQPVFPVLPVVVQFAQLAQAKQFTILLYTEFATPARSLWQSEVCAGKMRSVSCIVQCSAAVPQQCSHAPNAEQQRLRYDSGHRGNVFQARAFPSTGLAVIVTCAADGQVTHPSCIACKHLRAAHMSCASGRQPFNLMSICNVVWQLV